MRMAPALLPQESLQWLKELPPGEKTVFVNHYPLDSSMLNYFDVTRELKRIGTRLVIGGHWHSDVALITTTRRARRSTCPPATVPAIRFYLGRGPRFRLRMQDLRIHYGAFRAVVLPYAY